MQELLVDILNMLDFELVEPLNNAIANSWVNNLLSSLNGALNAILNLFRETPCNFEIINSQLLAHGVAIVFLILVIIIIIGALIKPFKIMANAFINLDITNTCDIIKEKRKKGKKNKWKTQKLNLKNF